MLPRPLLLFAAAETLKLKSTGTPSGERLVSGRPGADSQMGLRVGWRDLFKLRLPTFKV